MKKGFWKRYRLLFQKFLFYCLRNGHTRAAYLKKHGILRGIGDNVYFYSRVFPADPKLLTLHNNISIATNVRFINHDRIDIVLKGSSNTKYTKKYGCIEIMDNVFLGADVTVLPDVRIGPNVIVGAGSVVTKDVPPGTVVAGIPARVIGSYDEYVKNRKKKYSSDPDKLWAAFEKKRNVLS